MKTTTVLLLLAFSALALAGTKPSVTMNPARNTNDQPSNSTTTKAATTKAATTKAATTKAATTKAATTKAPTTKAPITKAPTTKAPTTKAPITKAPTTKAPTTKAPTTMPPTPTKPPAKTNSTVGNYTVDINGQLCVMVQMDMKFRLVSKQANGTFQVFPNKTSTSGNCNTTHATLNLISKELNLTMWFFRNVTGGTTFVNRLALNLTSNFAKKAFNTAVTYKVDNTSIHLFNAKTGKSYSCKEESLDIGGGFHIDFTQDRMQAFNFTKSNEFGITDPCKADQNNYRVAIAVGITLLVLVVVVVVAYLLARRKRTEGYQSL